MYEKVLSGACTKVQLHQFRRTLYVVCEKKKDCETHGAVAGAKTVLGMAEGPHELIRKESNDLPATPGTGTTRRAPYDKLTCGRDRVLGCEQKSLFEVESSWS